MSDYLFILLQKIVPQKLLSKFAGIIVQISWQPFAQLLIRRFIHSYRVNLSEADRQQPHDYNNFHDFFTRTLRTHARTISTQAVISPCDGTIADIGVIKQGQLLQAKKHLFHVNDLTATDTNCTQGYYATIYLSPRDYHRVHMPCSAQLTQWRYLPGKLFSVNTKTAQYIPKLYSRNERLVCKFHSDIGTFYLIMVGAMLVSGIVSKWHGKHDLGIDSGWQSTQLDFLANDEIGYFCFGSTVILIMSSHFPQWNDKLLVGDTITLGQTMISSSHLQEHSDG